jgi:hypothetical protein
MHFNGHNHKNDRRWTATINHLSEIHTIPWTSKDLARDLLQKLSVTKSAHKLPISHFSSRVTIIQTYKLGW